MAKLFFKGLLNIFLWLLLLVNLILVFNVPVPFATALRPQNFNGYYVGVTGLINWLKSLDFKGYDSVINFFNYVYRHAVSVVTDAVVNGYGSVSDILESEPDILGFLKAIWNSIVATGMILYSILPMIFCALVWLVSLIVFLFELFYFVCAFLVGGFYSAMPSTTSPVVPRVMYITSLAVLV